jgi:nucleoside-diphosphate kinase
MAIERTLSIIKPDGIEKGIIGKVISRLESASLTPVGARMVHLSRAEAEGFYAVHRTRPFFQGLVEFMTSGPVLLMVLEGESAVAKNREVMGATDPRKAAEGTIRRDFGSDIEKNTVHGSDSPETARTEIACFFRETDICPYPWKRPKGR